MYGSPETTAGGGNALPFYASCRLRPQTQRKIERKISAKKAKILGVNVKIKNVKNKAHRPFVESDGIQLLFDKGINPLSGLLSCLLEADRIESKSAGNFTVKDDYLGEDKENNKFKSSMDRNDVPMEILLKNPKLIDAESRQEIEEYLEPYMGAINFEIAGDIVETTVSEDENIDDIIDAELT
jgi:hypothetical protein